MDNNRITLIRVTFDKKDSFPKTISIRKDGMIGINLIKDIFHVYDKYIVRLIDNENEYVYSLDDEIIQNLDHVIIYAEISEAEYFKIKESLGKL